VICFGLKDPLGDALKKTLSEPSKPNKPIELEELNDPVKLLETALKIIAEYADDPKAQAKAGRELKKLNKQYLTHDKPLSTAYIAKMDGPNATLLRRIKEIVN
jgi:hypothetical protein